LIDYREELDWVDDIIYGCQELPFLIIVVIISNGRCTSWSILYSALTLVLRHNQPLRLHPKQKYTSTTIEWSVPAFRNGQTLSRAPWMTMFMSTRGFEPGTRPESDTGA
jgi:hypothetical protein